MNLTVDRIKQMLDVALLRPTATAAEIKALAEVVRGERFGFICVYGLHTKLASSVLQGCTAKVVSCVGFPTGAVATEVKVIETERAVADGAGEIDMVLNLGSFIAGELAQAGNDIRAVVRAAAGRPVKVIIETPLLTRQQKVDASRLAQDTGASFVKTCTGTTPDPIALYEDIRLIRQTVGPAMGIKASGRVGSYFRLTSMIEAGATRVGLVLDQAREILRGCEEEQRKGA
jgi:deoxyribose-phosphate aldolase